MINTDGKNNASEIGQLILNISLLYTDTFLPMTNYDNMSKKLNY